MHLWFLMHVWPKEKGEDMTHQRGPLLWTIAIHVLNSHCLTKMAKELYHQQHLQLGLCLPALSPSSTPLLCFLSLEFSFPSLGFLLCPWTSSTSSSCHWPSVLGSGTMNGLSIVPSIFLGSDVVQFLNDLSIFFP